MLASAAGRSRVGCRCSALSRRRCVGNHARQAIGIRWGNSCSPMQGWDIERRQRRVGVCRERVRQDGRICQVAAVGVGRGAAEKADWQRLCLRVVSHDEGKAIGVRWFKGEDPVVNEHDELSRERLSERFCCVSAEYDLVWAQASAGFCSISTGRRRTSAK